MTEKLEYKTPRASVRGVFLCENLAGTETSVLITGTGAITQDEWVGDGVGNSVRGITIWILIIRIETK
jgi:hypothetical protein